MQTQIVDGLHNGVDLSCGIEIAGWYMIDGFDKTMFMHDVESNVKAVVDSLLTFEGCQTKNYMRLMRSVDPEDCGYDSNSMWRISVLEDGHFSPTYNISVFGLQQAQRLAQHFSTVFSAETRLEKWARIRAVWKNGELIREFKSVPYTNGPDDWV